MPQQPAAPNSADSATASANGGPVHDSRTARRAGTLDAGKTAEQVCPILHAQKAETTSSCFCAVLRAQSAICERSERIH